MTYRVNIYIYYLITESFQFHFHSWALVALNFVPVKCRLLQYDLTNRTTEHHNEVWFVTSAANHDGNMTMELWIITVSLLCIVCTCNPSLEDLYTCSASSHATSISTMTLVSPISSMTSFCLFPNFFSLKCLVYAIYTLYLLLFLMASLSAHFDGYSALLSTRSMLKFWWAKRTHGYQPLPVHLVLLQHSHV